MTHLTKPPYKLRQALPEPCLYRKKKRNVNQPQQILTNDHKALNYKKTQKKKNDDDDMGNCSTQFFMEITLHSFKGNCK